MSTFSYDVIVVGAGHAGCEAASAAARMGAKTVIITMDMNKIAQMSCNPAVGGIAKGQIVREIDALGGQMGLVTDAAAIQFRMLNRSKGPAMWSPRAQCDRMRFIAEWRKKLENTPNLDIWQDEAAEILVKDGQICGLRTIWGAEFRARCVIITAGTFLNGLMHIGRKMVPGGRCSEPAATLLTQSIVEQGISFERMKTGTPVRIDARSVHFEDMEVQLGDDAVSDKYYENLVQSADSTESVRLKMSLAEAVERSRQLGAAAHREHYRFSYISPLRPLPQLPCWTCNTNAEVHRILKSGLADSPLYNGQIQSIGPRYCPSIETKLVTFAERDSHPLFLEPEGLDTNELYLNGFSSSLPMDVQIEALKAMPCFRDIKVYRPGYAIEYDFFQPTQLYHTLESKKVDGLFFAGQVNGTTGYEEAAGQGLMAGINAALKCSNAEGFTLGRDEGYIGVLIDDLVTKGVDEPYRMFTSRAEYRILLRQDNADTRLTPYAEKLGLATEERLERYRRKEKTIEELIEYSRNRNIAPKEVNSLLEERGSQPLCHGVKLSELIARPEIRLSDTLKTLDDFAKITEDHFPKEELEKESKLLDLAETLEETEILIKYDGYITRERALADKMQRLENIKIRGRFDYSTLSSLSTEARQKLTNIDPETLAQASRIPGVSPSDISVLLVLLGR